LIVKIVVHWPASLASHSWALPNREPVPQMPPLQKLLIDSAHVSFEHAALCGRDVDEVAGKGRRRCSLVQHLLDFDKQPVNVRAGDMPPPLPGAVELTSSPCICRF